MFRKTAQFGSSFISILLYNIPNIFSNFQIQKNKPVVQGDESLETYLRTEVARWKRE